jgi:hypothetical protein
MIQATDSVVAAPASRSATATTGTGRQQLLAGLLLTALAGAACAQGAFYSRGQGWLVVLLTAAGCLALTIRPIRSEDGRRGIRPVAAAGLVAVLAGWPMLTGALHAQWAAGLRLGLLALAVPVIIGCSRRLTADSARLLLDGLVGLGALLALLGWYGTLRHRVPLAISGQGLYRAASTLTYPNAAGVLLALLALLGIALAAGQPAGRRWDGRGTLLAIVLVGLAATLSRGALLAFAAGLLVLATGLPGLTTGLGMRRVLTVLAWPLAGAAVGTISLLPSMPVSAAGNPALAIGGLLLGAAIGSVSPRPDSPARWLLPYGLLALGGLAIGVLRPFPAVTRARLNLDSPDRWAAWRAAWQVFTAHPVAGAGPGLRSLSWPSPDGGVRIFGYAHNEYLQLLADCGLVGLVLLVAGLAALAAGLRRYRIAQWPATPVPAAAAAVSAALLVSIALDFIGHFPALVLTAAAVAGCAAPVRPARP